MDGGGGGGSRYGCDDTILAFFGSLENLVRLILLLPLHFC